MIDVGLEPKTNPKSASQVFPQRRTFTVHEFHAMIEAGVLSKGDRAELFDGEVIDMAPIGVGHAAATRKLANLFPRNADVIVDVQNPLRLSEEVEVYPDVFLPKPEESFYSDRIPTANDVLLTIEISDSTLPFDRGPKLARYAEAGVPEVWIVDLKGERVLTHRRPLDGVYGEVNEFKRGASVKLEALGEAEFAVDDILPQVQIED